MKKYKVTLTAEERQQLSALLASGKAAARKLAHARVLLHADAAPGGSAWTDERIAEAVAVGRATVERLYREIRAFRIYEGTTEIQKIVIAGQMLHA